MIFVWAACAHTTPAVREAEVLIEADRWVTGDPAADPLAAHRSVDAVCPEVAVFVEGGSIEVDTGRCTYAWLQQPLLSDLVAGDAVELVLWHSTLSADAPAQGHLAVMVGEALLYERWVDIPAVSSAYNELVWTEVDAEPGAMVGLHLHNHGANTWNLLRVERQASP